MENPWRQLFGSLKMKNNANINVRCQEKHKTMLKQLMAFKEESEGFIIRKAVEHYYNRLKKATGIKGLKHG